MSFNSSIRDCILFLIYVMGVKWRRVVDISKVAAGRNALTAFGNIVSTTLHLCKVLETFMCQVRYEYSVQTAVLSDEELLFLFDLCL